MAILHFSCPACGKHMKADERYVGFANRCPDCGTGLYRILKA